MVTIYVPLCDNQFQGIIPVPPLLGNGDDPKSNLYWGAGGGFYGYFKKNRDYREVYRRTGNDTILETVVFERTVKPNNFWKDYGVQKPYRIYLVGKAYRGRYINKAMLDFVTAVRCDSGEEILLADSTRIGIDGKGRIVGYMGHNGLLDAKTDFSGITENRTHNKGSFVFGCFSVYFFYDLLKGENSEILVLTNNLMCPEAYNLDAVIESLVNGESGDVLLARVARTYDHWQHCGYRGARKLFVQKY